jgi:tetratricopeptide (TPR) repeat protein
MGPEATPAFAVPLVLGRGRELSLIDGLLQLGPDLPRVLLLEGEPGIGKSALLQTARSLAADRGYRVLVTVGVEAESRVPFAGLHQLLGNELGQLNGLEDPERTALLVSFGLADGLRPEAPLIAQATLALLQEMARAAPVLLVVDDLQWIDPISLDVMTLVARRLQGGRVTLVASARSGYALPGLGSEPVTVSGLDLAAARAVLDNHTPGLEERTRDLIIAEAAGNPLALLELPGSLVSGEHPGQSLHTGPGTLSDRLERAFTARLTEVPAATRDALLLLALYSGQDQDEVLQAVGASADETVEASVWTPALDVGLLRQVGNEVMFRHPLVRSGVVGAEPLARRYDAHRALAEQVQDPYLRTWHLGQSIVGPDDAVADQLVESARSLAARGALMPAVTNLERAAHLTTSSTQRSHRLLDAAQHAFELGRADLVGELLAEARRGDLTELDGARLQWLREILHDGRPGDAARVLELCEWAERAVAANDLDLALNLLLGAGLRCWWADTGPEARARAADVLDSFPLREDPRLVAALAVTEPVLRGGQVLDLLDELTPAVSDENGDVLRLLGMAAHAVGDSPRAAALLDRAEAALRRHAQHGLLAQVWSMQVIIRLELGNLPGAIAAVDEGLRLARLTGQPIWNTGTLVCAARAEAMRGDTEKALDLAARAELEAAPARLNDLMACVAMAQGLAHLDSGDAESAYLSFRSLFDSSSPHFHQRERFDGVMYLARSAALAGQEAEARRLVEDLELVAAVTPAPLLHVHLLYARAVLADDSAREELFRRALDADLSSWPWVRGQTLLSFGRWLAFHRRSDEARAVLLEGRELFVRTGAVVWTDEVQATLDELAEVDPL